MPVMSLQNLIDQVGDPLNVLRADRYDRVDLPAYDNPPIIIPQVPHTFSRWERESDGWRKSVALFDLTHHMCCVFVEGKDAQKFLGYLSCNVLFKSKPNSASQIICVNEQGRLIGDGIAFHYEDGTFGIYGTPAVHAWIEYNAQNTDLDVKVRRDHRSPVYANGKASTREEFRFQIQGPLAKDLIEKLNGGPIPDVHFFGVTEMKIAGKTYKALRHGMAGAMGVEVWGPYEEREKVRNAILESGQEFDIRIVGALAYLTTAVESGWFQCVIPAIYGEDMRGFREWLPYNEAAANLQIVGSKIYDRVDGYYRTPYDLGYGPFMNLDHDCIGRDALAAIDPTQAVKKVTLAWRPEDAAGLFREMISPGGSNVRFLHVPIMFDGYIVPYDTLTMRGKEIGISAYTALCAGERSMLSLALVEQNVEIGTEVVIHWGEAGGGYGNHVKPATAIYEIRAIVSPVPYAQVAREKYRASK